MFDEYDNRIVEHNGKTWETDYEGYLLNSPYAVIFKSCNFCNSEKAERNALI